ncbi:MAG: hypothetical protein ACRD2Z_14805 [Thermoanaerobaculia bacterium]
MRPPAVATTLVLLMLPAACSHSLAGRSFDGVLVQLEWVPTYSSPDAFQTFGRLPELTLYEDGTVIYLEETKPPDVGWKVRTAQLGREERSDFVNELLERGFERLESHMSHSGLSAEGTDTVVFDSSYSVITVRLPNGKLRTIRNYAGFANDRQALKSIREFLSQWSSPDAEPYTPAHATLFIKRFPLQSGGEHGHLSEAPWTLPAALLRSPKRDVCEWAVPIGGPECRSLILRPGSGPQWSAFVARHLGERFYVSVVPWLPNEHHSAAVRRYRHRCP